MSDHDELLNQQVVITRNIAVLEKKFTRKQNALERFGQGSMKKLRKIQDQINFLRDEKAGVEYNIRVSN